MKQKIDDFFLKIDTAIFKLIDEAKASPHYAKFNEALGGLDDDVKKIIHQVLLVAVFLVPLMIVFMLFISNMQLRGDINTKKELYATAKSIISAKKQLLSTTKNFIGTTPIRGQVNIESKIRAILTGAQIDLNNVKVEGFAVENEGAPIVKSSSVLNFKNFSMADLSSFITGLIDNEKFKISKTFINRDSKTKLLMGKIDVIYLNRSPVQ